MGILGTYIMPHPPVILPEVGRGREKRIHDTVSACREVAKAIRESAPETIVVISPHSVMYADYIHISPGQGASGDFGRFGAPDVRFSVSYDARMASDLAAAAAAAGIDAGMLGEKQKALDHGVTVPLYFIEKAYEKREGEGDGVLAEQFYAHGATEDTEAAVVGKSKTFPKLVRISISGLSALTHYKFGICLQNVIEESGRKTVIVASGDLSHKLRDEGPYKFSPEGPAFDEQVTAAMKTADFLQFLDFDENFTEAAGECGLRSFIIMAGALDRRAVAPAFLSYEGTFGVGYAVCKFIPSVVDETRHFGEQHEQKNIRTRAERKSAEDPYVRLARLSLETFVKNRKPLQYREDTPEAFLADRPQTESDSMRKELTEKRAGVFVSLKKDGKLRGCIGTVSPVENSVAEEIIRNAVSAGVGDPRFEPVRADELKELAYSVDVLEAAEPVKSKDELDVKNYGVIVTAGRKRGLLLPALAGVTTVEQQLSIALQKAGISENEDYVIERFKVVRHY